jgi:hypothetical protein
MDPVTVENSCGNSAEIPPQLGRFEVSTVFVDNFVDKENLHARNCMEILPRGSKNHFFMRAVHKSALPNPECGQNQVFFCTHGLVINTSCQPAIMAKGARHHLRLRNVLMPHCSRNLRCNFNIFTK